MNCRCCTIFDNSSIVYRLHIVAKWNISRAECELKQSCVKKRITPQTIDSTDHSESKALQAALGHEE